jgi:hypothetical protein
MHPRKYALVGGLIMLVMGLVALIPSLSTFADWLPRLRVEASYGLFLGYFPMNIFNKAALIIFGLAGIAAAYMPGTSLPASIRWSRWVFYVMGAAAILGFIPSTNTLAGIWPLFGNEIWAHGLFAVLGAYFGYSLPMKVPDVDKTRVPDREALAHR